MYTTSTCWAGATCSWTINREQPRRTFKQESLEELAESIKTYGIIQPIVVSKKEGYYSIVAGERRWRAAKLAGLEEIPAIIRVEDDGIGIPEEKLNEIRRFTEKAEKHFGLYSVNHRLLLYYGEESGLQIESKYGEGTCITIEIPRGNQFDKNYDRGWHPDFSGVFKKFY